MHIAAFVATIGVFLGVVGPWVTLGKLGSRSGIYYTHGLIMLAPVAVMAAASFYAMILRRTKKPVPWQLVVTYLSMGIIVAVYAFWMKGQVEYEVNGIAAKFRLATDSLLGWGITSLPWTSGAVTLAGIMAFFMPGDVGGTDDSLERRRLG